MQTRISPINTNSICRSGVSAERRKSFEIQGCGFLPKAAALLLHNFNSCNSCQKFPAAKHAKYAKIKSVFPFVYFAWFVVNPFSFNSCRRRFVHGKLQCRRCAPIFEPQARRYNKLELNFSREQTGKAA
jgi:hypothetical protein